MANNETNTCPFSPRKTSVGGQALIEGIMMKGPDKSAMAIRKPDGSIELKEWATKKPQGLGKVPFVRGIFNFIDTLLQGYKCLMDSAEMAGQEEEPTKFELWLDKKFGNVTGKLFSFVVTVLALILCVGLFIVVPSFLTSLLSRHVESDMFLSFIEGVIKMGIFLAYIIGVSNLEDIRRTFMYHGAEHKTIFCYEKYEDLTVENVKKQIRFHPRCGTSFLLIVVIISILISSLITWESVLLRAAIKILLLPVTVGISYELIKFAGRHDNAFTRIISAPGLWLQRFTTKEPDDSMIEVAIAAFTAALPEDPEKDQW